MRPHAARAAAADLLAGPEVFPVGLDFARRQLTVVPMTREDYRRVAFHSRGALGQLGGRRDIDVGALLDSPPDCDPAAPPVHYVVHMGLCCSTLLGRVLECVPGVFPLREPAPLTQVTLHLERDYDASGCDPAWSPSGEGAAWLEVVQALLQRSYPGVRHTVVKAVPQALLLAPWLLARDRRSRGLYLYADPTTFLCQTLRTRRRRGWARRSLAYTRPGWRTLWEGLADAEAAALLWATRMEQYRRLRQRTGAPLAALDGSRLAVDRAAALGEALAALGVACDDTVLAAALVDPVWSRHAKERAPTYDAYDRQEELERVRLRFRAEIRRGLEWLAANLPWFAPDRPAFGADDGAA